MLYINNKFFNLDRKTSDEFDEVRKDFHQKVDALKDKFGDSVSLMSRKKPKRNRSGLLEPWQVITAPLRSVVAGKHGSEEWLYTSNIPLVKDGYIVPDTLLEIIQYGELNINLNKDPDKAYFYLYKHEFVKSGKLVLVDLQSDEEKKAAAREHEADLNFMIYNKASDLNKDPQILKVMARRWGVFSTDKLTSAQLKNQLYDKVMDGESKRGRDTRERGIGDFISDCGMDNTVKIGAVLQEAMDAGHLYFDDDTRQWKVDYKDGGIRPVVLSISSDEVSTKREVLIHHLLKDHKSLVMIENVIGRELTKDASVVVSPDIIENTDNISLLRSQAKALGINSFGMNKEKMKDMILEKISETI